MFTKYNSISIPENYSGNRFKKAIEETEMKTHKGKEPVSSVSSVKTSVSPFFHAVIEEPIKEVFSEPQDVYEEDFSEESNENTDTPTEKTENFDKTTEENISPIKRPFELLENIKNDDLLLLALLLLIAKDSAENSMDTLVILALLLMYH